MTSNLDTLDTTTVVETEATDRDPDLLPSGTVLAGRYRILAPIGQGGMAQIYRARHVERDELVAIKVLGEQYRGQREIVRRFIAEAMTMSRIRHRHVVDVSDFGTTDDGAPFFVMEYLEGQDLGRMLAREGRMAWPRVRELCAQICAGLAAAHELGIIHRDMKPGNCFVTRDASGRELVKLLDFGIAKAVDPVPGIDGLVPTPTRPGLVLGTAEYMAPEQAMGAAIDPRADLYAVGVLMFRLLTHRFPFRGGGAHGTMNLHITQAVPRLRDAVPELRFDPRLERFIARALRKHPGDRFANAEAMRDAMLAIEGSGYASRRMTLWLLTGVAATVGAAAISWTLFFVSP